MEVKQSYIDAFNQAIAKLKDEVGEYNTQVQAINDSVYEQVEDLNHQIETINGIIGDLRAIGHGCGTELRAREPKGEGLDPQLEAMVESWDVLADLDDMAECGGLELDELPYLAGQRGLLKDVAPLLAPPSETEEMIEQRIKKLQDELRAVRSKRELKP